MELDKTVKSKLESFQFDEEPSQESVNRLFASLDAEPAADKDEKTGTEGTTVTMRPDIDANTAGNTTKAKTVRLTPAQMGMRIAAGLVLLMMAGFAVLKFNDVEAYAARGTKSTVTLPDGSVVSLNADTRLAYNKLTWGFNRSVSLEGEAFFEVEKGSTFAVNSPQGTTTVLGTSFNVYDRADAFTVKCSTGKVEVELEGEKKPVTLTPGNGVTKAEGNKAVPLTFEAATANTWIGGTIEYKNTPLRVVAAEVERQFDLVIDLQPKELGNLNFNSFIDTSNRDIALRALCVPHSLTFTEDGRTITVTKK